MDSLYIDIIQHIDTVDTLLIDSLHIDTVDGLLIDNIDRLHIDSFHKIENQYINASITFFFPPLYLRAGRILGVTKKILRTFGKWWIIF